MLEQIVILAMGNEETQIGFINYTFYTDGGGGEETEYSSTPISQEV